MVKISIRGGTKNTQKLVRSIAEYSADLLMGSRLADKVSVRINLKDDLCKKHGVLGSCVWEDDNLCPREFRIDIDTRQSMKNIVTTVAHEMVHVKQFAKREMVDLISLQKIKWQGKRIDDDKLDYYDMPWEIEAHGREVGLYNRWRLDMGITDRILRK